MFLLAPVFQPLSSCNVGNPGSIPGSGRTPEKGMATRFRIPAWRIPWTEEPGGLQCMGLEESDTTWQRSHQHHHVSISSCHVAPYCCIVVLETEDRQFLPESAIRKNQDVHSVLAGDAEARLFLAPLVSLVRDGTAHPPL